MNAVVTGAGRGLGLELARQLLGRGARVIGTTRRHAPALETLGIAQLPLDVSDTDSIAAFAEALSQRMERLRS